MLHFIAPPRPAQTRACLCAIVRKRGEYLRAQAPSDVDRACIGASWARFGSGPPVRQPEVWPSKVDSSGFLFGEPLLSLWTASLDPLGSASCAAELLVAAHLPHSHLTPSKPGRRPNGNNFEPVPRRVGRVADRRRSAMVRSFLSYILIPHSEQAGAWQVDADDVHGAVARFERGAVAGVDGAAIVPDGAAARGDADPEPQAVARVRTPAFRLRLASITWRARGVCLRVQLRALSGNACAAYERWGRGERDAAVPRHGRDKAAGAR